MKKTIPTAILATERTHARWLVREYLRAQGGEASGFTFGYDERVLAQGIARALATSRVTAAAETRGQARVVFTPPTRRRVRP